MKKYFIIILFVIIQCFLYSQEKLDIDMQQNNEIEKLIKRIDDLEEKISNYKISSKTDSKIRASTIEIIGSDGETQIIIGAGNKGGMISINNKKNNEIAYLGANSQGGGLIFLQNNSGKQNVFINTGNELKDKTTGGSILLSNSQGDPRIKLRTDEETDASILMGYDDVVQLRLDSDSEGSLLRFFDNELLGLGIGYNDKFPILSIFNNREESAVNIGTSKDGSGLIQINNERGDPTVFAGSAKKGGGLIQVFDRYGDVTKELYD